MKTAMFGSNQALDSNADRFRFLEAAETLARYLLPSTRCQCPLYSCLQTTVILPKSRIPHGGKPLLQSNSVVSQLTCSSWPQRHRREENRSEQGREVQTSCYSSLLVVIVHCFPLSREASLSLLSFIHLRQKPPWEKFILQSRIKYRWLVCNFEF